MSRASGTTAIWRHAELITYHGDQEISDEKHIPVLRPIRRRAGDGQDAEVSDVTQVDSPAVQGTQVNKKGRHTRWPC